MRNFLQRLWTLLVVFLLLSTTIIPAFALPMGGTDTFTSFEDEISDPNPSETAVIHTFRFDPPSADAIDTVEITFHGTGDSPASVDDYLAPFAALSSTDLWGTGTYAVTANSGGKEIVITRNEGTAVPVSGVRELVLSGATNAATEGTYYVTVATLSGATYIDAGTTAFVLAAGVPLEASVTPSFSFSVADNGVKDNSADDTADTDLTFGTLGLSTSSDATTGGGTDGHEITVSTNATNGYSVQVLDTANGFARVGATVSSGDRTNDDSGAPSNDVIFDYSGGSAPTVGEEAYYFQVTSGSNADAGLQTYNSLTGLTPKTFIDASGVVDGDQHTIMYGVQVHAQTPPGTYTDEITYIATPNF